MKSKNRDIEDLTKNNTHINIDEVSPQDLEQIAGGVSVEDQEEEDCGVFGCNTYSPKLN